MSEYYDAENVARQEEEFSRLLEELGPAGHSEVRAALEGREPREPEAGLTPEVVECIRRRIEEADG